MHSVLVNGCIYACFFQVETAKIMDIPVIATEQVE